APPSPARAARTARRRSDRAALVRFVPSERLLAGHEAGLDGQLLDGALDRGAGHGGIAVGQLEEHAPRLHDRHPALGVALARTHAGLGWLLRHRLVREHVDPDLAAPANVAGHRDAGRFDLAGGDPARLEGLDPVVTEGHLRAALRLALQPAALARAVPDPLWHHHRQSPPPGRKCAAQWGSPTAPAP